jgi:hypothetical protein
MDNYDEFGNYIGPQLLGSDDEDDNDQPMVCAPAASSRRHYLSLLSPLCGVAGWASAAVVWPQWVECLCLARVCNVKRLRNE